MPITGTSTDYTGRKKDISILQGVNPAQLTTVAPSFGKISQYCAGIQKLIQRYAICLLTEIGSQANNPTFGTNLISTLLSSSSKINQADVYHIFNFANANVIQSFRDYQRKNAGLPTDEQIDTTKLIGISVKADTISLNIQVFPITGTPVVFLIPLPSSS